jgi:UDP-N-acetylmuramoyl-tripeptide--D-alanyl-D-alanine ligase
MYAAIDVLMSVGEQAGNSIAVLGDMAELGDDAAAMHFNVGQYAALAGVNRLYAIGKFAAQVLSGFGPQASNDSEVNHSTDSVGQLFTSQDDLITQLLSSDCESSVVLVKGSRSAAMDNVVSALNANNSSNDLAQAGAK